MRHYLWYDVNNQLRGEGNFEGGWPDGVDPSDPNSTHSAAVQARDYFSAQANFQGILEYTCPCPPEELFCDCTRQQIDGCYVDESSLVLKETINFVIDGASKAHNNQAASAHLITADAAFTLRLDANLPDGTEITLKNCAGTNVDLLSGAEVMTFTSGQTNTLNLTAPPAGLIGGVFANCEKLHPFLRAVVKGT